MLPPGDFATVCRRLKKFGYASLNEYLESFWWRRKKDRYFKTHDYKCASCGSVWNLNLHHKTYKRLCCEWMRDLVYLCEEKCHPAVHEYALRKGWSVAKATRKYLRRYRFA